ncbi:hypothetical protein [Anatilimnocola floriformis]|uniref:hypothetical protein n=1 Tax=Anatilimnocola floriformis TaxID=2948575 RepID=UPI0020C31A97|nr:hypothetical protein [Anatilimnocola floriformis]
MTIEFPCPQCSQVVRTPDAAAGKKGKCPSCQAVVVIPAAPTAPSAAAKAVAPKPVAAEGDAGPIEFFCNFCGQVVRTPRATAGKKGRCPHCTEIVLIPLANPLKSVAEKPAVAPAAALFSDGGDPFGDLQRGVAPGMESLAVAPTATPPKKPKPTAADLLPPKPKPKPAAPPQPTTTPQPTAVPQPAAMPQSIPKPKPIPAPVVAPQPAVEEPVLCEVMPDEVAPLAQLAPIQALTPLTPLTPLGAAPVGGGNLFGDTPVPASAAAAPAGLTPLTPLAPLAPLGGAVGGGDLFGGGGFSPTPFGESKGGFSQPAHATSAGANATSVTTAIHIPAIIQLVVTAPFALFYLLYFLQCAYSGLRAAMMLATTAQIFRNIVMAALTHNLIWGVITLLFLAMQGAIIFGSIQQLQRRGLQMAQIGAWIALFPCASPMGMPAAIWSLICLNRPDVRQTFRR